MHHRGLVQRTPDEKHLLSRQEDLRRGGNMKGGIAEDREAPVNVV
jgi:hypothetical protein